jgi:hypothetical protein
MKLSHLTRRHFHRAAGLESFCCAASAPMEERRSDSTGVVKELPA